MGDLSVEKGVKSELLKTPREKSVGRRRISRHLFANLFGVFACLVVSQTNAYD